MKLVKDVGAAWAAVVLTLALGSTALGAGKPAPARRDAARDASRDAARTVSRSRGAATPSAGEARRGPRVDGPVVSNFSHAAGTLRAGLEAIQIPAEVYR